MRFKKCINLFICSIASGFNKRLLQNYTWFINTVVSKTKIVYASSGNNSLCETSR